MWAALVVPGSEYRASDPRGLAHCPACTAVQKETEDQCATQSADILDTYFRNLITTIDEHVGSAKQSAAAFCVSDESNFDDVNAVDTEGLSIIRARQRLGRLAGSSSAAQAAAGVESWVLQPRPAYCPEAATAFYSKHVLDDISKLIDMLGEDEDIAAQSHEVVSLELKRKQWTDFCAENADVARRAVTGASTFSSEIKRCEAMAPSALSLLLLTTVKQLKEVLAREPDATWGNREAREAVEKLLACGQAQDKALQHRVRVLREKVDVDTLALKKPRGGQVGQRAWGGRFDSHPMSWTDDQLSSRRQDFENCTRILKMMQEESRWLNRYNAAKDALDSQQKNMLRNCELQAEISADKLQSGAFEDEQANDSALVHEKIRSSREAIKRQSQLLGYLRYCAKEAGSERVVRTCIVCDCDLLTPETLDTVTVLLLPCAHVMCNVCACQWSAKQRGKQAAPLAAPVADALAPAAGAVSGSGREREVGGSAALAREKSGVSEREEDLAKPPFDCPTCRRDVSSVRRLKFYPATADGTPSSSDATQAASASRDVASFGTKISALIRIIETIANEDAAKGAGFGRFQKSIVFSELPAALRIVALALKAHNIPFLQLLNASTQSIGTLMQQFRDSAARVLLLPASKAATGLTITEASHVFLLEPFERNLEAQAISRICRPGQTRPTFVHRLIVRDTIEELIYHQSGYLLGGERRAGAGRPANEGVGAESAPLDGGMVAYAAVAADSGKTVASAADAPLIRSGGTDTSSRMNGMFSTAELQVMFAGLLAAGVDETAAHSDAGCDEGDASSDADAPAARRARLT